MRESVLLMTPILRKPRKSITFRSVVPSLAKMLPWRSFSMAWIRPSRTMRGWVPWGSWQWMQPTGLLVSLATAIDIGGAVPLGLGILVAHELPLEDMVGGLALDAGRIAGHGGFRQFVVGALVVQHIPGLADLIDALPAVLELEAAALETIDHELVDDHEGMGARLVVLKGEAVAASSLSCMGERPAGTPFSLRAPPS